MVMGTPWYMSPEQARGDSRILDRRSDVYSLGATLYELLAGRPPFDSDSSLDVLVKLLNEEPVPVGSRHPQLPADVQTIVMKCLEKDPGNRYESARALADDLGRYLEGEPIRARASGLLGRLLCDAERRHGQERRNGENSRVEPIDHNHLTAEKLALLYATPRGEASLPDRI